MTDRMYLALIGDIRRSRELPERAAVQKKLEDAISSLNDVLPSEDLEAAFAITLGDEFQGLLRRPSAVLRAIIHVEAKLPAVRIRYGLGWGAVATELRDMAMGMDGPCFHLARDAVGLSKEHDRWGTAAGFGEAGDAIVTGLLSLLGAVREGWTVRQAETVALARLASTQREVAAQLSVGPSTVSEALSAAQFGYVQEAERSLELALDWFGGFTDQPPDSTERPNS
jgi:hypothetical protein